ncbi:uncharacterized protein FFB20_02281 [Fusarium fujikuroi]|uniref:Uncharacterized protein n=1 Tax=Gibberella fujikuroi (strain CBS 195.34 / IMI 58289 / NRRL A-6831) TaxID=1279085 RepID=S0EP69_GIBF5|nr:uncharacterized protein FFUJ_10771 [Fusarium fujikuroi IMI 58289]KLP05019.1 uncharacterized protein Y057_386 [Fusarium fujikuroi]CCT74708.1 uncharacterized protein FFUJ_10771 [Fusarium fujikuroi IMI 58289]SCN66596.1 uncharacterized protein FFB20_02281 [Fusarium fujikuroi]SCO05017.1 uncharacterized protein FFM5_08481 [Fusarium fujikuroi]SCO07931.1 uncharacterized protein FFC1_10582 [Fusarium fujikuroi]
MRFAGSLILGLLAVNGLAQTVIPDQDAEPSAIAQPEPSAPAAEPSNPAQDQPSDAGDDGDAQPTDADSVPSATNGPEPTAVEPSNEASQASGDEQPTATASDDDEDASTAEGTATADATATDADATATASETDDDDSTDTATATATSSSAPTSTGTVVEVDLKNATIGENAQLVKVDGKDAIKLSAPANGQATFSVAVDSDDELNTDELIYIVASILVGEPSSAKLRRRADKTDCTLQIQADGQSVYEEPLYTNNGQFQDVTSSGIQSSDKPEVQVTQKCGDKPSPLTVNNVRVGNESGVKSSAGSGGSGSGGSGSGSGSGSGGKGGSGDKTSTATGASASETGDSGNIGARTKASVGALAAAILAAAAML